MTFKYKTLDGEAGSLDASSKEEALEALARMSIVECYIGKPGEKMELAHWKRAPKPARPKEDLVVSADDDDEILDVQEKRPPIKPIGWSDIPDPSVLKPKPPVEEEPKFVDVKRKQSVFHGLYKDFRADLEKKLSLFGEVKWLDSVSNMRGEIILTIVVEHDEPLKKPEEKKS